MAIMATHTHCLAGTSLAISDFESKSETESKSEMDISDLMSKSETESKSEMDISDLTLAILEVRFRRFQARVTLSKSEM